MASTLRRLSDLIQQAVLDIEKNCEANGITFPELDDPYDPTSEAARSLVEEQTTIIAAAANQLLMSVRRPQTLISLRALDHLSSAALSSVEGLNVADILDGTGPAGLHAEDIAKEAHADPNKLSRILRFLSVRGIFREVKPDIFVNNGPSSILIKGKSSTDLFENPESKYSDPRSSIAAIVAHLTDESAKGSSYMSDTLTDPEFAFSGEPTRTPFNKAFNFGGTIWDFFEQPENKMRETRFGVGMEAARRIENPANILKGFDWTTLPKDSVVVDVGGGVGSVSMVIAKAHEHLKIVVQDRAAVVEIGRKRWEATYPEGLSNGRVTFQTHDFFEKQPIQKAEVYILRAIIHDWSDAYAGKILKRLREASGPKTRLLCIDKIIPYACRVPEESFGSSIPGLVKDSAPEPLFANFCSSNPAPFNGDMNMFTLINGHERTINHFRKLFDDAGWKIVRVYQKDGLGASGSQIEAHPIKI